MYGLNEIIHIKYAAYRDGIIRVPLSTGIHKNSYLEKWLLQYEEWTEVSENGHTVEV